MCNCANNIEKIREIAKKYAIFFNKKVAIYQNIKGFYNFAVHDFAVLNQYNIIESYEPTV